MKEKGTRVAGQCYKTLAIMLIILVIRLAATDSGLVEKYYTRGVYEQESRLLRALTGWLPFSLGDLVYAGAIVFLIIKTVRFVRAIFKREMVQSAVLTATLKLIRSILGLYLIFLLLWGLNYNRKAISDQLDLRPEPYTTADLVNLSSDLAKALNWAGRDAGMYTFSLEDNKTLFASAVASYRKAQLRFPFLAYQVPSIKATTSPVITNYFGVPGYYNPFTGEAQVNTNLPRFVLPYLLMHEMAHQIGYAKEEDASLAAYIACKSSADNGFRYSVYFQLFNEVNRELFRRDSFAAINNYNALDSMEKQDERMYSTLISQDNSDIAHLSTNVYDTYLRLHEEGRGVDSYKTVITLILAYRRRYGEL